MKTSIAVSKLDIISVRSGDLFLYHSFDSAAFQSASRNLYLKLGGSENSYGAISNCILSSPSIYVSIICRNEIKSSLLLFWSTNYDSQDENNNEPPNVSKSPEKAVFREVKSRIRLVSSQMLRNDAPSAEYDLLRNAT